MKNLNGLISGIVACIVLGGFSAHGQSLAVSLTGTYSGGTAYAYAETTSDYATGYYYDLCTYIAAEGEEDDGTWDFYETSGNCSSTDAEQSWTFTPTGTTDLIEFVGQHVEYIDYLVYQIDEYCGFDAYACGDYWDAYEMSVLDGEYPGGSGAWVLWGPPAFGLLADQIAQYTEQDVGTECPFPDDLGNEEVTTYIGNFADDAGYWNGEFYATLNGPYMADFTGREVKEAVVINSETCFDRFGDNGDDRFIKVTTASLMDSGEWDVEYEEYGDDADPDEVGDLGDKLAWYQSNLAGMDFCWDFQGSQTMSINQCFYPSVFDQYGSTNHGNTNTLSLKVLSGGFTAYRGGAYGDAH